MIKESFINKIKEVKKYISANKLADAIELLTKIASAENQYKITDALTQIKQTYSYMMHYMLQGVKDSSRADLYLSIKESLLGIADDLMIGELAVESPEIYYSSLRICLLNQFSLSDMLKEMDSLKNKLSETTDDAELKSINAKLFNCYHIIFDILWTSRKNTKNNEVIQNWIIENKDDHELIAYFLVPITLSLLKYYDSKKLALLINLYNSEISGQISALSMTAVLMVFNTHLDRIRNDADIVKLIKIWTGSETVMNHVVIIAKQILHTFDTDRAFSKMNNEVIPELIKMRPEFIRKFGDIKLNENIEELENNPAWEEMMENTGLADKLKELSEMQSEGADLMMISFSNLKQFHFFNNVDSWFIPFSSMNPAFSGDQRIDDSLDILNTFGNTLCSSDKYSLAIALQKMSVDQSMGMIAQLRMQINQAKEMFGGIYNTEDKTPEFEDTVKSFIKSLHRFFKLFNKRNEFNNPFDKLWKFDKFPAIGTDFTKNDISQLIAEYYFKLGLYSFALYWFKNIERRLGSESFYWEKTGYCNQCINKYNDALTCYRKAELLKEPSLWLLKQLALISMKLDNKQDALMYYNEAKKRDPDNLPILFNLGNLNLEIGNIPQALQSFYHANYIAPEDIKIWRAIGWSELLNKNYEKSDQYYSKILSISESGRTEKPSSTDYMNAGHAKLLMGRLHDASILYTKAAKLDKVNFEKDFIEDIPILKSLKVDPLTIDILLDHTKMGD